MHNLEQINGETAFVAYRQPGWHGLGQVVEEELTAESAIQKAMLDWEVELHPLYSSVMSADGVEVVPVEDKFAVIRKHPLLGERDALGVVGTRYTPIQNREVFNFLDALVDSGSSYETAGSIDGGKKIFITMRMPNGILVGGKDKSDMYIFATTSHDGSFSLSVALTAVRVVCQNTWRMARRASQYKHTIRLDPQVVEMFTIIFPWGKYSYLRLPMGYAGLADIFQAEMMKLMESLEYV